ncbi:MAG: iron ABC transporter permease [Gallionella sp.]
MIYSRPLSFNFWRWIPLFVAALVLVPVGIVFSSFFTPPTDIWQHLVDTMLTTLLLNTFWLALFVAVGTLLIGVSLAWLTAVCDFPGRKFFSWALLLPLTLPAYVTAFVALGLFDYSGPVQTMLRSQLGAELFWFPEIRGRLGVSLVMVLAFYPYVYLLTRNAFLTQGKRSLEAAQSLGFSRTHGFFKVTLPMARPWIMGGLMLAMMETLADFGTVAVFNYDTFTTAIYKAWFGLFSLNAASQLASLLIIIAFALLIIEQQSRARMRFSEAKPSARADRIALQGWRGFAATAFVLTVLFFGFLLPVMQLLMWSANVIAKDLDARYLGLLGHSLVLSALAALLTCTVALLISYSVRRQPSLLTRWSVRISTLGYALPGTVLAVGVFIPISWMQNRLSETATKFLGIELNILVPGALVMLLLAYLVRFLAVGHSPIDSAMHRITRSIDEAAMAMGLSSRAILHRVHLPILKSGLLTAITLVFVDVMKEMPITLMTRPFGWDTLAVRIFELTSEGEWERAALPSVALVLAGLIPIILFIRQSDISGDKLGNKT